MEHFSDLVRFGGGLFLESGFSGDWCLKAQVSQEDCGSGVNAGEGLMAFHYVLAGCLEVRVLDGPVQIARAGDLILLPRNAVHFLGSSVGHRPLDVRSYLKRGSDGAIGQVRFGPPPHEQVFVCGFISLAVSDHPLVGSLPEMVIASLHGTPAADWARNNFVYAANALTSAGPGAQPILARIAEGLFTEAIRSYATRLPPESTGWLPAMRDQALSRALAACHNQPAAKWTTEALARVAFLSRSTFAERFTHQLGCPPMTYLTRWRMALASRRLAETNDTLAQIASEIGYESESTFSRAFTRERGCAPGEWRRRRC
jgi:AraC-like DNA-binding protein